MWKKNLCRNSTQPTGFLPPISLFSVVQKVQIGSSWFCQKIMQSLILGNLHHALWTAQEHVAPVSPKDYFSSMCWHHHGYQQKSVKLPTTCSDHAFLIARAKMHCSCLYCIFQVVLFLCMQNSEEGLNLRQTKDDGYISGDAFSHNK